MNGLLKGAQVTFRLREGGYGDWLKENKVTDIPLDGKFKFWVDLSGNVIGKYGSLASWRGIQAYFEKLHKLGKQDYTERLNIIANIIDTYQDNSLQTGEDRPDNFGDLQNGNDGTGDAGEV